MAVGVAMAVVLPWVIFNFTRFDRPVLLTTNDGSTLIGSNCDETYYGPAQGGWSLFCVVNDPGTRPDEDTSERAARQRHEALSYARHHIGRLPNVVVKRVGRSLDVFALRNMVHGDVGEERERWASWAGIVSFWVMAPLAVVGAVHTRRRDLALPTHTDRHRVGDDRADLRRSSHSLGRRALDRDPGRHCHRPLGHGTAESAQGFAELTDLDRHVVVVAVDRVMAGDEVTVGDLA